MRFYSTDVETGHIGHPEKEGGPSADESGMLLLTQKSHSDNNLLYNILFTLKILEISITKQ